MSSLDIDSTMYHTFSFLNNSSSRQNANTLEIMLPIKPWEGSRVFGRWDSQFQKQSCLVLHVRQELEEERKTLLLSSQNARGKLHLVIPYTKQTDYWKSNLHWKMERCWKIYNSTVQEIEKARKNKTNNFVSNVFPHSVYVSTYTLL